jgi:AmiR/NasT family two-component response regulator
MATDHENIIELLSPREIIGQAIALLMTDHGMSRDAAFARLVHASSGSRRKVRDIAAEIVQQRREPETT